LRNTALSSLTVRKEWWNNSLTGMIDNLSQLIFNVYEAFTVAVFTLDRDSLLCRSSVTFAKSFDRNRRIPVEATLPGWVLKHGEPLVIPNFDRDEATLGYYNATEEIKSFIGYPMEGRGVLVVDSKKRWAFPDREKKILGNFARVLQEEMEREKKSQEIEERLEELLLERRMVGICNELQGAGTAMPEILKDCISFSGAEVGFIGMERNGRLYVDTVSGTDKEAYEGRECPAGVSMASMVLEGGREFLLPFNSGYLREKPVLVPEETLRARQFFGFPLLSDETAFGVLGFIATGERPLKEQSIALLRDAAALLSLHCKSLWMKEYLKRTGDIEPVTGSLHFSRFLRIIEKASDSHKKFALLSLKIGGIEAYNRRMGVEFTNSLLMRISDTIRYCAGSKASVTRKGGGHFYVMLKDNGLTDARNVRKILEYTVTKSMANESPAGEPPQVESGLAHFPADGSNPWELFTKADIATTHKY
jgi:GGDEF domain-containing protein